MAKTQMNESTWFEYFSASTGIREDTMDFASNEISGSEWLKRLAYYEPSWNFAKRMVRESGICGTRRRICRYLNKSFGHSNW